MVKSIIEVMARQSSFLKTNWLRRVKRSRTDRIVWRPATYWAGGRSCFFIGFLVRSGFMPERDDYIEYIVAEATAVMV